jgi:hypothetical protein
VPGITSTGDADALDAEFSENVLFTISMAIPELEAL